MHSTLNPKPTDAPRDFLVVAPDVVLVAPTDEELFNQAHDAVRHPWDPQNTSGSNVPAGPTVPPVDTTFRPAVVNDVLLPGHRRSLARRAVRAFMVLLLAACIGGAAIAWQSYGDVARQMIANWVPQIVLTSLLPEKPGPAAPAVEAAATNAVPSQPAAAAQSAAEAVAPTPDSAQLLQSMTRDLASLGQQVEQLKAGIAELKASQQQMSREIAKASEQNKASEQRPQISALPPRPAAARTHKPVPPPFPPRQAATAPPLPPAGAPYYAPRPEPQPQFTAEPPPDPELSSVPRPPMPLR